MKKTKQLEMDEQPQKPVENRFQFVTGDSQRLAIPVGPPFQADVPAWTDPPDKEQFKLSYLSSDSSKWLGTRVWPPTSADPETEGESIGAGRPNRCRCTESGSIECIRRHLSDKRNKLQTELGFVFWKWKFDSMGEEVSNMWNQNEQEEFESLVKRNPTSQDKSFLKPAMESLTTQTRQTIVNYYFNVYLPRRMSTQIRSGRNIVDTDDEGGEEEAPSSKKSRKKRPRRKVVVKTKYLTGRR